MPLPLIVIVLAWIAAAIAAGALSVAAGMAINAWLKSGKVALIGRVGAGKTTLLHVLEHGDVPRRPPDPTVEQTSRKVSVGDAEFTIIDSGGDRLEQWMGAIKASKGVVYMFDASLVARGNRNALSALTTDADHIEELLTRRGIARRVTLAGTHSDLLKPGDEVLVRDSDVVQRLRLACNADRDDVVIGSFKDKKSALRLAGAIAKRQTKKA